ncbi:MAG TPA: hypothetical protein VK324_03660 [Tepidisphaeraceae bacterium]|nr:hypothetical protein [Tepidisphaeraceae bacterium]
MDTITLAILLYVGGLTLFLAEVFLPAGGIIGLVGGGCLLAGIGVAMVVQPVWGTVALLATVAATPLAWAAFVRLWPRTPIGRRVILKPVDSVVQRPPVAIGQTGTSVSELRPIGICEFPGGHRVEARSELGIVPARTAVTVVAFDNNKPVVRMVGTM